MNNDRFTGDCDLALDKIRTKIKPNLCDDGTDGFCGAYAKLCNEINLAQTVFHGKGQQSVIYKIYNNLVDICKGSGGLLDLYKIAIDYSESIYKNIEYKSKFDNGELTGDAVYHVSVKDMPGLFDYNSTVIDASNKLTLNDYKEFLLDSTSTPSALECWKTIQMYAGDVESSISKLDLDFNSFLSDVENWTLKDLLIETINNLKGAVEKLKSNIQEVTDKSDAIANEGKDTSDTFLSDFEQFTQALGKVNMDEVTPTGGGGGAGSGGGGTGGGGGSSAPTIPDFTDVPVEEPKTTQPSSGEPTSGVPSTEPMPSPQPQPGTPTEGEAPNETVVTEELSAVPLEPKPGEPTVPEKPDIDYEEQLIEGYEQLIDSRKEGPVYTTMPVKDKIGDFANMTKYGIPGTDEYKKNIAEAIRNGELDISNKDLAGEYWTDDMAPSSPTSSIDIGQPANMTKYGIPGTDEYKKNIAEAIRNGELDESNKDLAGEYWNEPSITDPVYDSTPELTDDLIDSGEPLPSQPIGTPDINEGSSITLPRDEYGQHLAVEDPSKYNLLDGNLIEQPITGGPALPSQPIDGLNPITEGPITTIQPVNPIDIPITGGPALPKQPIDGLNPRISPITTIQPVNPIDIPITGGPALPKKPIDGLNPITTIQPYNPSKPIETTIQPVFDNQYFTTNTTVSTPVSNMVSQTTTQVMPSRSFNGSAIQSYVATNDNK